MLDTVHPIETPEGVDLDLRVAGAPVRLIAWIIDFLVRVLIGGAISIPILMLGSFGAGIFLLVMFLLEEFYPILFEVLSNGSTPGKKAMRLQVVHSDGTPVGWMSSVLRNLLRTADFLPMFYGFGLVTMLFSGSFQRLGDLAAGTLVVYRDSTKKRARIPNVVPRPSPIPLRLQEQRAVISFGQRGPNLPPARAEELSGIATPLLDAEPIKVTNPVEYLYCIAAWLVGRRQAPAPSPRRNRRAEDAT